RARLHRRARTVVADRTTDGRYLAHHAQISPRFQGTGRSFGGGQQLCYSVEVRTRERQAALAAQDAMMRFIEGTLMNVTLAALLTVAFANMAAAQGPAPAAPPPVVPAATLIVPATPEKAPDAAGFIQRWLLLE